MSNRTWMYALASGLCISTAACDDPSSLGVAAVQPLPSISTSSALTGRIVYTLRGQLRVYDVASKADVGLGVAGINPRYSPNGSLIAYQNDGLYIMNSDGTGSRLLNATGGGPAFDPTGTVLAFGDNGTIWKINIDGTGLTRLTAGYKPAWSPDGTQIAYHTSVGGRQQLHVINADGSLPRQILSSAAVLDVVWYPSAKILFAVLTARNYELHSYDPADLSSLTRLTYRKGNDFEPSWSPDGTAISWASLASPSGIWIMNADGSGQHGPVIAKGRQGSWGP